MDRRMMRASLLLLLAVPGTASAVCQFHPTEPATFLNPTDPDCNQIFTYTESNNSGQNLALGYPVPMTVASQTAVAGFRDYASLFARHQDLMMTNAGMRGQVLGQTLAGRDIWIYQFGDADTADADGQPEAAMLINSGTHPREWSGPESATELIETLVETQTDDYWGEYLHDQINLMVVPVLNVDSFLQTQLYPATTSGFRSYPREGRMRRKNLRDSATGTPIDTDINTTADNQQGVDLNRNSGVGFGQNGGSSGDVTSIVYRGPSTATEPEILALHSAAAIGPADRLRYFTDLHAFTKVYLQVSTGNARRDAIDTTLATRMSRVPASNYRVGGTPPTGSDIGSTDSWFGITYDIPSYTLETEPRFSGSDYGGTGLTHSGFVLPVDQVARVRDEIANMFMLGFYYMAGPAHLQAIRIAETGGGAVVYQAEWLPGSPRTVQVSTNTGLVGGSDYEIWLAFDKPMRWRIGSGSVINFPGQTIGLTPNVQIEFDDGASMQTVTAGGGDWLNTAGGPGVGYLRYRNDAWMGTLSVPAVGVAAVPGVVSVATTDFAGLRIDGDASTGADWSGGAWIGYEDDAGQALDTGGTDCGFRLFVAAAGGATDPGGSQTCVAKQSTGGGGGGGGSGGGGGGGSPWLLLLAAALGLARRRLQRGVAG
jgi:zinc carboxypeptidase